MADINVLDLTPTTPGSNDSLILFDRTTGEGKSTRFDTLSGQVLDSKFGDSNPTAGQELSYDATTGKYKNTSQIASLNEALTNQINKNGAKNLLPLTVDNLKKFNTTGTWNGNIYSGAGLTYEVLTDADGNVTGVKVNGTSTATSLLYILIYTSGFDITVFNGMIINGSTGSTSPVGDYGIRISDVVANSVYSYDGDGHIHDLTNTGKCEIAIRIASGRTLSNKMFYPMIRLDSDSDPTYQPYAMTNRELTDNKIDASQIAPIENGATASTSYAQGAYFIHNGKFCKAKTSISSGATFTKGTNYEETTVAAELIALA